MRKQNDPVHVVMPGVHRVASLLQRWLLGTHQGAVGPEHFGAYLNEFTFRFKRRHSRRRGMLFYRLLEQSIAADPITYSSLIANPKAPADPTPDHHDQAASTRYPPSTAPGDKPQGTRANLT